MHIGILITGHAPAALQPKYGDYDAFFARLLDGHGFHFSHWNVVDMEFPEGPHTCDGWLLTGSRHGVYEDHPFIAPLADFVRACHAAKRPMIGICFGHQIMAQALGGRVEKFAGGWTVGRQSYDFGGTTYHLNAWHQDQVVAMPPGATLLARNDRCAIAALTYGPHAVSVQPHPEFDDIVFGEFLDERGPDVLPQELENAARGTLGGRHDAPELADRFAAFFKSGAWA